MWIWSPSVLTPACRCSTSPMVWTGRLRISLAVTLRTVVPCLTSTNRRSAVTSTVFTSWTTTSESSKLTTTGLPVATTTPARVPGR
jgi:hypothetical protein